MSYQKSTAEGGDELGVALHIERAKLQPGKPCRARRASDAVPGSGGLFVLDAPTRAPSTLRRPPLAAQGPLLRYNDSSRARRPHRRPRPFWLGRQGERLFAGAGVAMPWLASSSAYFHRDAGAVAIKSRASLVPRFSRR